jgi:hypothetical protein
MQDCLSVVLTMRKITKGLYGKSAMLFPKHFIFSRKTHYIVISTRTPRQTSKRALAQADHSQRIIGPRTEHMVREPAYLIAAGRRANLAQLGSTTLHSTTTQRRRMKRPCFAAYSRRCAQRLYPGPVGPRLRAPAARRRECMRLERECVALGRPSGADRIASHRVAAHRSACVLAAGRLQTTTTTTTTTTVTVTVTVTVV